MVSCKKAILIFNWLICVKSPVPSPLPKSETSVAPMERLNVSFHHSPWCSSLRPGLHSTRFQAVTPSDECCFQTLGADSPPCCWNTICLCQTHAHHMHTHCIQNCIICLSYDISLISHCTEVYESPEEISPVFSLSEKLPASSSTFQHL